MSNVKFEFWSLMLLVIVFFTLSFVPVKAQLLIEYIPTPNDPLYNNQSSYLEQVKVPEAWAKTTGSPAVVIAVIDSGTDMDHPDIIGNMWFNRGEIPLNGLDDDHNGFVDDLNGWDFLENTSDVHPKFHDSDNFTGTNHGTVVAGVAAEASNNEQGLTGVCWQCRIMALRAVSGDGTGLTENVAKAIQYAIDNGADIINMSFVGSQTDEILNQAIARAHQAGIVLVAAVGNDADENTFLGGDLDFRPLYPVCADGGPGVNQVLGVGSIDKDNRKSSFSNFGLACIDINAPGNGLASAQVYEPSRGKAYDNKYRGGWRGTSVATPLVAGVAGLMKSINPSLSNDQIIAIIRQTATSIDGVNPQYAGELGAGLLNAEQAVEVASHTVGLAAERRAKSAPLLKRDLLIIPGPGRPAQIKITDSQGQIKAEWLLFPESFRGGANAASGDVDGDGQREIVAVPATAGGPQVRIFSPDGAIERQWFAYDKNYRGGLSLAVADLDQDGTAEIITAAGGRGQSEVKIFNSAGKLIRAFSVANPGATGPVVLSLASFDNQARIITGAPSGALPMVQIFDTLGNKVGAWLAYNKSFRGGLHLASGDVDGDGETEIVAVPASAGGPQVRIFSAVGKLKGQFFAFENNFRGGASLAMANVDTDKAAEIIVGAGPGRAAETRVFSKYGGDFAQDSMFTIFEKGFKGGVNVGI